MMHPLIKVGLRAGLGLTAVGVTAALVFGGGSGHLRSAGAGAKPGTGGHRDPAPSQSTTTTLAVASDPAVGDAAGSNGAGSSGAGGGSGGSSTGGGGGGFESSGGSTANAAVVTPTTTTTAALVGPPPTIPESGVPLALPITGAVTAAGAAGFVLWRRSRRSGDRR